jgi:uncharacterized protein (DUF362 family)
VVLAATDPLALDLAAVRLMGFDWMKLPKLARAMQDEGLRITAVRSPADVEVARITQPGGTPHACALAELEAERPFLPHPGWRDHVELENPSRAV